MRVFQKTVHRKQKPTTSVQQSRPHTISQYSSSVFCEKNGLLGNTTSSLNHMEQKVIPNQGTESTNAVGEILGLQSDDFSSQNLASSKIEEQ